MSRRKMKAAIFVERGRIVLEDKPIPDVGPLDALQRLMSIVGSGRVDLKPLVTHRFKLDQIEEAYAFFEHQRDGVLKVAITP